jgi:hypothetical protein
LPETAGCCDDGDADDAADGAVAECDGADDCCAAGAPLDDDDEVADGDGDCDCEDAAAAGDVDDCCWRYVTD